MTEPMLFFCGIALLFFALLLLPFPWFYDERPARSCYIGCAAVGALTLIAFVSGGFFIHHSNSSNGIEQQMKVVEQAQLQLFQQTGGFAVTSPTTGLQMMDSDSKLQNPVTKDGTLTIDDSDQREALVLLRSTSELADQLINEEDYNYRFEAEPKNDILLITVSSKNSLALADDTKTSVIRATPLSQLNAQEDQR